MNLAECYRLLGLTSGASFEQIKASYRRLARQYHPDINPHDRQAKDKFIQLTTAYQMLLAERSAPKPEDAASLPKVVVRKKMTTEATPASPTPSSPSGPRKVPPIQINPKLSPLEQQLKESSYQQLQQLFKEQKFPRSIALVEGLVSRLPQDPEVIQWQAIAYQRWGRQLIHNKQPEKARIYLKKALRADPHNRSLWAEVEKDFRRIEQLF
jgi:tetratricopeptide (TPR) repeat protein